MSSMQIISTFDMPSGSDWLSEGGYVVSREGILGEAYHCSYSEPEKRLVAT